MGRRTSSVCCSKFPFVLLLLLWGHTTYVPNLLSAGVTWHWEDFFTWTDRQHERSLSLLSLGPAEHVTGSSRWTENNADGALGTFQGLYHTFIQEEFTAQAVQYNVYLCSILTVYTDLVRRTQCAEERERVNSSEEKDVTQLGAPAPLSNSCVLTAYYSLATMYTRWWLKYCTFSRQNLDSSLWAMA